LCIGIFLRMFTELHCGMRFYYKMAKTARKTHDLLKVTFGDEAWDWSTLCEWHKLFKSCH